VPLWKGCCFCCYHSIASIGHHSSSESRQDPRFLAFVVGCAAAALLILAHDSPSSARVQAWQSVIATRELASSFVELEFDHVWNVIANCLTASAPATPVHICIWQRKEESFECVQCYGAGESESIRPRIIDVLRWNPGAVMHYDLIMPLENAHKDAGSDDDKREEKKQQLSF
jgi:hypothetical protein